MKTIGYNIAFLSILTLAVIWLALLAIPLVSNLYENCNVSSSSQYMNVHVCTSGTYYTVK